MFLPNILGALMIAFAADMATDVSEATAWVAFTAVILFTAGVMLILA